MARRWGRARRARRRALGGRAEGPRAPTPGPDQPRPPRAPPPPNAGGADDRVHLDRQRTARRGNAFELPSPSLARNGRSRPAEDEATRANPTLSRPLPSTCNRVVRVTSARRVS